MNGKELVPGRVLYASRAQKRIARQGELKRKFKLMKQECIHHYQVLWGNAHTVGTMPSPVIDSYQQAGYYMSAVPQSFILGLAWKRRLRDAGLRGRVAKIKPYLANKKRD